MENDIEKRIEMLEKYVVNHEEDIKNNRIGISNNAQRIECNATALDLLHTSEANGKRTFIILIIVLVMWFSTIGAFLYYINTTGIEETTEIAEVENEDGNANACVGDSCNNGEITYGESKGN